MAELETNAIERRVLFVAGPERPCTVRDLIDAAHFRGEVEPIFTELCRMVAAEAKADAAEEDADDDAIDSAAEQFRYEHDLITAEETERWLEERGLSLGDFTAHFIRHYWGQRAAEEEPAGAAPDYLSAPNELRELLPIELILSGELDRMAERSSWREAAALAAAGTAVEGSLPGEERARFLARAGLEESEVREWLRRLGRDQEWLGEQLEREAIYGRDSSALLTREARAREIGSLRLPLTNFDVETIEFDSLDAAREALLCVRDDGMAMEEVATEGRYPYRHREVLLEGVPEDLQQKFLSVAPGTVLDPITRGEGFHLCRILSKAEPKLDDPLVQERADDRILYRHFADLTAKHIRWRNLLPNE